MKDARQLVNEANETFTVILKKIAENEDELLIAPYPKVKDSPVRPYRKIRYDQIEIVEQMGKWESAGRAFPIVAIRIKDEEVVSLKQIVGEMFDEKIVEPKTRESIAVAWNAIEPNRKGGIYVMGSCESCWCDNLWC
jgi:hypothetical protein